MDKEGINQDARACNEVDTALDAVFTAAGIGMLAAIQQGLDLDGGLAQIIGPPPMTQDAFPGDACRER